MEAAVLSIYTSLGNSCSFEFCNWRQSQEALYTVKSVVITGKSMLEAVYSGYYDGLIPDYSRNLWHLKTASVATYLYSQGDSRWS
jgi:hypothetical protein